MKPKQIIIDLRKEIYEETLSKRHFSKRHLRKDVRRTLMHIYDETFRETFMQTLANI